MAKLLLIDNYDSFTYNVARYLVEVGAEVEVVKNDALDLAAIAVRQPSALVISPGPGTPCDAGISLDAIRAFAGQLPILGICLGHQAIAQVWGAKVVRSEEPWHGKTSQLAHRGQGLFEGLPSRFTVGRYHSLVVEPKTLPNELVVDAWVAEAAESAPVDELPVDDKLRTILAIRHRLWPVYGIQYHPESVLSEQGHAVFARFLQCLRG
jgi:anthranilate synthase/aminodeoxychorismate synthase-like glutamine amidotransferase